MLRIGLTGGIASGKSPVGAMLRELGFQVLDADRLAHQLMEPGQPAYEEIVREFGGEILAPDGRVARAKLGGIVFADRQRLERLNAMLHPRVREAARKQFDDWERSGVPDAAFVEAALIVEAGMHKELDGLVVVWCRPEQQVARLQERGMSEAEARSRVSLQMPNSEKLQYATEKIDCSGTLEETRREVWELAAKLRRRSPAPSISSTR
jgi:dephospho-CoA kinase